MNYGVASYFGCMPRRQPHHKPYIHVYIWCINITNNGFPSARRARAYVHKVDEVVCAVLRCVLCVMNALFWEEGDLV